MLIQFGIFSNASPCPESRDKSWHLQLVHEITTLCWWCSWELLMSVPKLLNLHTWLKIWHKWKQGCEDCPPVERILFHSSNTTWPSQSCSKMVQMLSKLFHKAFSPWKLSSSLGWVITLGHNRDARSLSSLNLSSVDGTHDLNVLFLSTTQMHPLPVSQLLCVIVPSSLWAKRFPLI